MPALRTSVDHEAELSWRDAEKMSQLQEMVKPAGASSIGNRKSKMKNPWIRIQGGGPRVEITDPAEQLKLVAKYDLERLIQIVRWPDTHHTVKLAATRRIRAIQRGLRQKTADRFEGLRGACS